MRAREEKSALDIQINLYETNGNRHHLLDCALRTPYKFQGGSRTVDHAGVRVQRYCSIWAWRIAPSSVPSSPLNANGQSGGRKCERSLENLHLFVNAMC